MALLPDGKIVSASRDRTLKIWDINNYRCIRTLEGHENYIYTVIVLPDGNIVSGSHDNTIKIWNCLDNYNCINTLTGHTHYKVCIAIS